MSGAREALPKSLADHFPMDRFDPPVVHGAITIGELELARRAVDLADELCQAIDNAEKDIGGSRPIPEILRELGPAAHAAKEARK